jgi:hypothetical protein
MFFVYYRNDDDGPCLESFFREIDAINYICTQLGVRGEMDDYTMIDGDVVQLEAFTVVTQVRKKS